ncbi:alpha/beta fold hydrolase [Nocardioides lijunqiniae]|uniref:alpha/beta fold hydrolase n=1 Tax=Nocardioides lijunqiniae TaxID=2760832 RepID=UPI0018787F60|nr:alpha/beta hydrolase [Nocardioides lijunqiniae]
MSTYVLVHGSWSGGWQWQAVREQLEQEGHRVLTPTLTGMGDRHHLATEGVDLMTHVDDIARLIQWERLDDVVLVGHSYGGMVITGAAAAVPDRIDHLVYLDAFLPRSGQCAWDILEWQRESFQGLRLEDRPWLVRPVEIAQFFPELEGIDMSRLTPMPIATHERALETAVEPGWIAATYVHATSPAFFDDSAKRAAQDGMRVVDVDAGHQLLSTHPDFVAELLLGLSRGQDGR